MSAESNISTSLPRAELEQLFTQFLNVCKANGVQFTLTALPPKVVKSKTSSVVKQVKQPGEKKIIAPNTVKEFILWFCTSPYDKLYKVTRSGWSCSNKDDIWFLTFDSKSGTAPTNDNMCGKENILAFRLKSQPKLVIANAGSFVYFGMNSRLNVEAQIAVMTAGATPVPLQIITDPKGLNIDIKNIKIKDWTGQEELVVAEVRQRWNPAPMTRRHFAGAVLMTDGTRNFLLDADRKELQWGNFNAFFTQVPRNVTTVEDAYKALLPVELRGKSTYVRQGELFFEPVSTDTVLALMQQASSPSFTLDQVILKHNAVFSDALLENLASKFNDSIDSRITRLKAAMTNTKVSTDPAIVKKVASYIEHLQTLIIARGTTKEPSCNYLFGGLREAASNVFGFGSGLRLRSNVTISLNNNSQLITPARGSWTNDHRVDIAFTAADNTLYVIGVVDHGQHLPVFLPTWHRVYKNTATGSWNITGTID